MRKLKRRKLTICPYSQDLNPVLFDSRAHTVNYMMSRTWGTTRGSYVVHYPHPHQGPVKGRSNALALLSWGSWCRRLLPEQSTFAGSLLLPYTAQREIQSSQTAECLLKLRKVHRVHAKRFLQEVEMSSLCFTCSVFLRPSPTPGQGQRSQRQGCTDLSQGKAVFKRSGKTNHTSEVSRAIWIRFLLEKENFKQILDNTPVLVTSGTRREFGLSRSIIMDMGTWPGEKTHTKFYSFPSLACGE